MKPWRSIRQFRSLSVQGLALALLLVLLVCKVRRTGFFAENAELPVHDLGTRLVWPWKAGHPDVVLVTIQDHSLGWPLDDGTLAAAIERMIAAEPSVIGIDLIRDRYLPAGTERLKKIGMDDRVVWVEVEPSAEHPGFAPPPFIAELEDESLTIRKVASATFPVDGDRHLMVRRGRIASWTEGSQRFSLAAMLAWRHLEKRSPETSAQTPTRLLGEIGSLSATAGGYWFKDANGESTLGREFLLKPVSDAAARFRKVSLEEFSKGTADIRSGEMPVLSLAELMDGTTDATWIRKALKDRIVIFGTHDDNTAKDELSVVGDPLLRGIKLHALTTAQLLRELDGEPPVRFLADGWEDGLVLVSCLLVLAILTLPRLPLVGKGVVVLVLVPLGLFTSGLAALKYGIWIPTAAPMLAATATGLGGLTLLWRKTSNERSAYLDVMNSHLGPDVAARVLARNELMLAGMKEPPETFEATALFGDLCGYSAASQHFQENGTPADFFAWLNCYLRPAAELTGTHGGFIKQFVGDGIYVIFGFPPETGKGHAQRAVDCARELALLIPDLNSKLPPGTPKYFLRMGIYTGDIHASAVGGKRQADYSFLGPTINKASRLESIDKDRFDLHRYPARILISSNTRAQLDDPSQAVAYREEPILLDPRLPAEQVWEILIESPQASATEVSSY
jgi:adenylate cyclase